MLQPTFLSAESRILVVDDEFLVLWALQDALEEMGFTGIETAATVPEALALVEARLFKFAFLDVNLGTAKSYDIARTLDRQGVPYAFVTGYGRAGVEDDFPQAMVLTKPIDWRDLRGAVALAS